jgi:nitronate monooxygenase
MNFQSATGAKAWRDIWGSGQGIGVIDKVTPAGELIDRLADEYAEARGRLCA